MSNKTPPAWAIEAAIQLSALDDDDSITLEYMAEVITRCSPDSEALAVAIETLMRERDWINEEDWHKCEQVIIQYRARFPKVTGE